MKETMHLTFASSFAGIEEFDSRFDKGIMRVAYPGDNRNGSSIAKEDFERAIGTMYNCPIVCNYDRATDTLGGHDMELAKGADGSVRIVNATDPVGVVPESARHWWEWVTDEDGVEREYLFVDALLWKRQEAYRKIKNDGITAQSMEITVNRGKKIDGVYHIYDFTFEAFCLIGVTPCYEGAALELFSSNEFKTKLSEMMQELKETFSKVTPSSEVHDTHPQNILTEGGEKVLHEKTELAARYGIDVNALDFSLDDFTLEELTEKFEAMQAEAATPAAEEAAAEPAAAEAQEEAAQAEAAQAAEAAEAEANAAAAEAEAQAAAAEAESGSFALTGTVLNEIIASLGQVTMTDEWGTWPRYCYVDCDMELGEVYCWDCTDWLLYGFKYAMDGDAAKIDFESKQRMKYTIVPFDEGEQASPFAETFRRMADALKESAELNEKYQAASDTITAMETELGDLRQFKADTESKALQSAREEVFAQFEDLIGVEAFEDLRAHCEEISDMSALEEKCFAIRGRIGTPAKFSMTEKAPKLKVVREEDSYTKEPYGGLFARFGIEAE